jgi:hypothetical protein
VKAPAVPVCPRVELHAEQPDRYLAWHAWAENMAKTHTQSRCPGCGLFQVWTRKENSDGSGI